VRCAHVPGQRHGVEFCAFAAEQAATTQRGHLIASCTTPENNTAQHRIRAICLFGLGRRSRRPDQVPLHSRKTSAPIQTTLSIAGARLETGTHPGPATPLKIAERQTNTT
jgi:hypothetical protein